MSVAHCVLSFPHAEVSPGHVPLVTGQDDPELQQGEWDVQKK